MKLNLARDRCGCEMGCHEESSFELNRVAVCQRNLVDILERCWPGEGHFYFVCVAFEQLGLRVCEASIQEKRQVLQLGDIEISQSAKTRPKTAISRPFHQGIVLQPHPVHT
jgi:hypothetical protein